MRKENKDMNEIINGMSDCNITSEEPENLNYHKQD